MLWIFLQAPGTFLDDCPMTFSNVRIHLVEFDVYTVKG